MPLGLMLNQSIPIMKYSLSFFFTAFTLLTSSNIFGQFLPEKIIAGSKTGFQGIQSADINTDGHPDLAGIGGYNSQMALWYLNDGQGHFPINPSDSLEFEFQVSEITIADLNGDGFLDMGVADITNTGKIIWYAGDGQGDFVKHPVEYFDGIPVGTFQATDVDMDGDQDLVLGQSLFASTQIRWVKNDGQGNFSDPYLLGEHSGLFFQIVIADLNNDGLPDVLVPNKITWYLNYGPGYFDAKPLPADAAYLFGITDVDGDGDRDLLAYGYYSNNKPILYRNTSTPFSATFVAEEFPMTLDLYDRLFTGDYDGDGDTDIMFNSTGWWENEGTGSFTIHDDFTLNNLYIPSNLYLLPPGVDLNGDGREEALIPGSSYVAQMNINPNGEVVTDIIVPDIVGAFSIKAFDFDGDGDLDIVAASDKLYWFSNEGGGQFGSRQTITGLPVNTTSFHFADADGDADLDIFVQGGILLRNLGFGFYANPLQLPINGSAPFLLFDFDSDGDTDIIGGSPLQFCENIGNGNLATPVMLNPWVGGFPAAVDMDGDADLDVAFTCNFSVSILQNDGAANFSELQVLATPSLTRKCWWTDLDGSGRLDVVVAMDSSIGWFPALADGTFDAIRMIYQSTDFQLNLPSINMADYDGDGDVDIMVDGFYHILIQKNDGTGAFSAGSLPFTGPYVADAMNFDLDGDKDLDLLFASTQIIGWLENVASESYLTGFCFWDKNENKLRDPGEPPFQNQILHLAPAGKLTFTDADGSFRIYADSGHYALSILPDSCWVLSTDSAAYHLFFDGISTVSTLDFGLKLNGTAKKLAAQIATAPTRCGFEVPGFVSVQNEGCALASGVFELQIPDSLVMFISASPPPDAIAPGLLTWQPPDTLLPGATFDIQLLLKIAGPEHLGDTLRLLGITRALDAAGSPETQADSVFLFSPVNCAYDPNDKLVNRASLPENYEAAASELVYTVRFQNTGTDTAFNVTVRDQLAPELDFATFRPLIASHPYSVTFDSATRTAVFSFRNVLLPDSSVNEPGSHGLLQFAIYPVANLPAETLIKNSAGIYFDFNPPVVTNMAKTLVEKIVVSTEQQVSTRGKIRLWPNPASEEIFLDWGAPLPLSGGTLLLTDLAGRRFLEMQLPAAAIGTRIELHGFPPGMFLVKMQAGSRLWEVKKMVKSN